MATTISNIQERALKALAPAVLRHRLLLSPVAEIEGRSGEAIVGELVERTEAPR